VFAEVDPTTSHALVVLETPQGPIVGGLTSPVATPAVFWAEPSGFGGVARIVPHGAHLITSVMYSSQEKSGLAYGGGIVFAGLGGEVLELDPRTGDGSGPPLHPPGSITALAYGGRSAWIGTRAGRLFRYAPGDHALALAARLPWEPTSLTVGGGYVWAASFNTGRIARIGLIPTSSPAAAR
jgi:hypothetical protein